MKISILGFPTTIFCIENNEKNNKNYNCNNSTVSTLTFEAFSNRNMNTQIHKDIDPFPCLKEKGGVQGVIVDDDIKNISIDHEDKYLQSKTPITKGNKNSIDSQIHTDTDGNIKNISIDNEYKYLQSNKAINKGNEISNIPTQRTKMGNLMVKKHVALEEYFGSKMNEIKLDKDDKDDIKGNDLDNFDMSSKIKSYKSYRNDEKGLLTDKVVDEEEGNSLKKEKISLVRKEKDNESDREFNSKAQKNEELFIIDSSWLQKLSMASPLRK
jgi:hypothetical protein